MFTETLIVATWDRGRTVPASAEVAGNRGAREAQRRAAEPGHASAGPAPTTHPTRGGYAF